MDQAQLKAVSVVICIATPCIPLSVLCTANCIWPLLCICIVECVVLLGVCNNKGVSRIFIMGFPLVRNYRNIFGISSDQLLTI